MTSIYKDLATIYRGNGDIISEQKDEALIKWPWPLINKYEYKK